MESPGYAFGKGTAFVFTRAGSTWTQQGGRAKQATGEVGEEQLRLECGAVRARRHRLDRRVPGDAGHMGAAWVLTRSGSSWTQDGEKLTASGETGLGTFGWSVALSAEGNAALIGARADDAERGAAWLFTRSGSTWTQRGEKLTGNGEAGAANFGTSLALSANAGTALIGGQNDAGNAGAAWAFQATSSAVVGEEASTKAIVKIAIERVKTTATALLVTVNTSSKGTVTLRGEGLQKLSKTLGAGVHSLRLALTKSGEVLSRHPQTIKLSARLETTAKTVSSSKDIELLGRRWVANRWQTSFDADRAEHPQRPRLNGEELAKCRGQLHMHACD